MSRDNGQGIFSMTLIDEVSKIKDIEAAKSMVHLVIDQNTTARVQNIAAARALVRTATSVSKLCIAMSNFSLSHQGLKTIR